MTDRKDAETVSLEKVKPQLVAFLGKQKKQEAIEKVLQEVRAKAEVKINLPEPPAPAPEPAPRARAARQRPRRRNKAVADVFRAQARIACRAA